jgi:hypothetical protein
LLDSSPKPARRTRVACVSVLAIIGLIVIVVVGVTLFARRQIRSDTRKLNASVQELPRGAAGGDLELIVTVAQLVVISGDTDSALQIEADYDLRYFKLEPRFDDAAGGRWTGQIRFGPTGSAAMALFRVKLGAVPPIIRVVFPRDLPIRLTGEVKGSFGAMELGGSHIEATDMKVSGGALSISFDEPLQEPMDRFVMVGNKGSIEVTGLGNASPRTVNLDQRFGELDLDLRGRWVRDVDIRLSAHVAGGGVWLPENVEIEGLDSLTGFGSGEGQPEIQLPRMRLDVSEGLGRLLFIDTRPGVVGDGARR